MRKPLSADQRRQTLRDLEEAERIVGRRVDLAAALKRPEDRAIRRAHVIEAYHRAQAAHVLRGRIAADDELRAQIAEAEARRVREQQEAYKADQPEDLSDFGDI